MENEKNNLQKKKQQYSDYARYGAMGFQMAAIIGLGAFGGHKLDEWLGTKFPVCTLVLTLLSVFLAIYFFIKDLIRKYGKAFFYLCPMEPETRKFLYQLLVFTLIVCSAVFLWNSFMPERYVYHKIWILIAFFFFITILIHTTLLAAARTGANNFVRRFMALTGIKLFVFVIILFVYGFTNPDTMAGFSLSFAFLYFLYSSFDVVALLKYFKNK